MLIWRACFFVVLSLLSFGAFAQVTTLQVLADLNAAETVDQVAKRPASDFSTLDTARTYPLGFQKALWLRIDIAPALAGTSDQGPLVLDFHQPFLDRVNLYSRDTLGSWQIHSAGDWIANAQWQLPGLSPLLKLPTAQMGNSVAYAKITSMIPMRINPSVGTLEEAKKHSQDNLLLTCLILGCISLMSVLGLVLAVTHLNATYAWFAVYAALALLAAGSYCGVTGYAFWPHSPNWTDISVMVFIKAAMLSQLVFVAHFFGPAFDRQWIPKTIAKVGIGLLCILPVYASLMLPHEGWPITHFTERMVFSFALIVGCGVLAFGMALVALRSMRNLSMLYLLAFVPLLLCTVMKLSSHLGWVPLPWLSFNAPLYALLTEISILLVAIQLHAKNHLSEKLIRRALDATDPLTGFVQPHAFKAMVSHVWNKAQAELSDVAIAYIQVEDAAGRFSKGFDQENTQRTLRIVRLLRTGTRPQDIVALRNQTTFAVVMPGISFDDGLEERLSRLVALGLMVDSKDPHSAPIRFRIAASTLNGFLPKLTELDKDLREKLGDASLWSKKSIVFAWRHNITTSKPDVVEAVWQRALAEAAANQTTVPANA